MYETDPYGIAERLASPELLEKIRKEAEKAERERRVFGAKSAITSLALALSALTTLVLIAHDEENYEYIFPAGGITALLSVLFIALQISGMKSARERMFSKPKKKTKLEETLSVFD